MDHTKYSLRHKYNKYKMKYLYAKEHFGYQKGGNNHQHDFESLCLIENHKIDLFERIDNYIKNTDTTWNYIIAPDLYKEITNGNKKLFLLDVRKPKDYASGHIEGATNIFWKDLFSSNNIDRLPCPKHNPSITIVVICYVGHTASQTLVLLRLLGFKAIVLKYGMGVSPVADIPRKGWKDYGLPLVYGNN